jgi:hypothetical protein
MHARSEHLPRFNGGPKLTQGRPFVTRCAYGTSCFDDSVPDLLPVVCAEHWALSHASDTFE